MHVPRVASSFQTYGVYVRCSIRKFSQRYAYAHSESFFYFLQSSLSLSFISSLRMGNQTSKRKKQERNNRGYEPEDNVLSTNTASSLSSILKGSGNNHLGSPLPASRPQAFPNEKPRDNVGDQNSMQEYSTSPMDQNQFTVQSQSQLTATSFRSIGKTLDIDECIQKLLDVGYSDKVLKSFCLKNSEINAICRMVSEIFMSQPVSKPTHLSCTSLAISLNLSFSLDTARALTSCQSGWRCSWPIFGFD
jgi:Serine-threonine protein phosphatase N-terminal domain